MIGLGLEPEPLAYRVRPQADECFDSWIERVATAHEITRGALLRHLGADAALAAMDLAIGKRDLSEVWHGAFDRMVEQLAWGVQIEPARIAETFLACDAGALLPRRLRAFACARCWYEAQRAGKPRIIKREWILRACWRCRQHGLPLSDMGPMKVEGGIHRSLADLARAVLEAERLRWKTRANPSTIRCNATVLDYLTQTAAWQGLGAPHRRYLERFAANSFHMSAHRIAMLAMAHGSRHRAARRFERLISSRLPTKPTPGGGVFVPEKPPYRQRMRLKFKPSSNWVGPDLLTLLLAYAEVRKRGDAERQQEAIFARYL